MSEGAAPEPRTLWLAADFPPTRGGVSAVNAQLMREAATDEWPDTVLVPRRSAEHAEQILGDRSRVECLLAGDDYGREAARTIRRLRPDVVVCLRAARRIRRVLSVCRRLRIPSISVVSESTTMPHQWPRSLRWQLRNRLFLATRIAANSEYIARRLTALGHDRARIRVIRHGVCTRRFRPGWDQPDARRAFRAELGVTDEVVVCSSARMVRSKGLDKVVDGFARASIPNPGIRLWLLGDGEERENLERQVAAVGVADRVRFFGWTETPERILAAADVHVFMAEAEAAGLVVLEAAAAGLPSIVLSGSGPEEYVLDDDTGFVLESGPGDVDDLVRRLSTLIGDRSRRDRMGRRARELAGERSWRHSLLELRDLIREVGSQR